MSFLNTVIVEVAMSYANAPLVADSTLQNDSHGADRALRALMEGTARARGDRFFETLVQYVAASLDVKASFVAEFDSTKQTVETIAVWVGDKHLSNFEFAVEGTPCKHVLAGDIQHFSHGIQHDFPANQLLKQLDAESYLAVPLTSDTGEVIGHLAVIDDKPMDADERELTIFHIFAARATAELIRRRTERDLDDSRKRESQLIQQHRKVEAEVAHLREELRSRADFSEIVGESNAIWRVLGSVDRVAPTDSTVLVLGETGTGKELVARAIHKNSQRSKGAFVRVNCAALPEALLESELFGHESGAFTGATSKRIGRFELAHTGTIFLDEIGEMPLAAQGRLLRVLQEQELERVGSSQTIRVDVRVIAATNRNLLKMVSDGTFREDLYYRLNVFPIEIPPLRERQEDIPTLVRFFVTKLSSRLGRRIDSVSDAVIERLLAYRWPGNIRELENVVERAIILTQGRQLRLPSGGFSMVPDSPREMSKSERQEHDAGNEGESLDGRTLMEAESDHIRAVLAKTNGVIAGASGAAKILGINPNTLRSRMKRLGIAAR